MEERRPSETAFAGAATAFLGAAAVVTAVQLAAPITRGWWLVAYLALVGGVAQALLGNGQLALVARTAGAGTRAGPDGRWWVAPWVLWNAGTITVAATDLAGSAAGVLAGSAALLVALGLFAGHLHGARACPRCAPSLWTGAYAALVVFLAVSVFTGAGLAGAL